MVTKKKTTQSDKSKPTSLNVNANVKDKFNSGLLKLWNKICDWDKEKFFCEPITEDVAPGYFASYKIQVNGKVQSPKRIFFSLFGNATLQTCFS